MSDRYEISCIIPSFNAADYIQEALDSIQGQTLKPFETIVVDDGSTDETAKIIANYGTPVTYIYQDNAGPGAARNRGIELARGDFLAFLDADDVWHPDKLASQMERFKQRPELEYCLTYKRNFWEAALKSEEDRLRQEGHAITEDVPGYVMQSMLARARTFEKVGLLDATLRIGEDTDWIARAEDMGVQREVLEDVLLFRRLHERNLSYECHSDRGLADRAEIIFRRVRRLKGLDDG
jgi:glycosyltransferase involved in cell wall biosynthesis